MIAQDYHHHNGIAPCVLSRPVARGADPCHLAVFPSHWDAINYIVKQGTPDGCFYEKIMTSHPDSLCPAFARLPCRPYFDFDLLRATVPEAHTGITEDACGALALQFLRGFIKAR